MRSLSSEEKDDSGLKASLYISIFSYRSPEENDDRTAYFLYIHIYIYTWGSACCMTIDHRYFRGVMLIEYIIGVK